MGIGLLSMLVFIIIIVLFDTVLKRTVSEGMFVAFIVVVLMGGSRAPDIAIYALRQGFRNEVLFPAMLFCFMGVLMQKTGIIKRLVLIMNSLLGKVPGGAGYASTIASGLMGMVAGSGSGNAAVSGSITIPWMRQSGFSAKTAATIVAGNATLAMSIPPSNGMFLLLAMPIISEAVTPGAFYIACLCGGLWLLLLRLITVYFFVKRDRIAPIDPSLIRPLSKTFPEGWKSLFIFVAVIIPLLLTTGPLADFLKNVPGIGSDGVGSINIIIWLPVCMVLVTLIEGWKYLPQTISGWIEIMRDSMKSYSIIGGTLFFAMASSEVVKELGMAKEVAALLGNISNMNLALLLFVIAILVCALAGPLTSTATLTAIGSVCFTTLTAAGLAPAVALTVIIIFTATEGSTPPASAPLYIAAGIAGEENPGACFKDLIVYYMTGSILVGMLVGLGLLPIIH